jgi:zinc and cadmium transporter
MDAETVLASIASVVLVSLVSLVGLFGLSMNVARIRRVAGFVVSFAVGALLGDAFIHLLPEAFAPTEAGAATPLRSSLLILGAMLFFFLVERLVRHRHDAEILGEVASPAAVKRPHLVVMNTFGDAIHNFVDGVLIGSSYLAGPTIGVSTTIAVLLHELPQELGDFAVLVHSGTPVRRAIWINLGTASIAILGTIVALLAAAVARETIIALLPPIAAGGFIYIACADLIPELQRDRSLRGVTAQIGAIAFGIAVMGLLTLLE